MRRRAVLGSLAVAPLAGCLDLAESSASLSAAVEEDADIPTLVFTDDDTEIATVSVAPTLRLPNPPEFQVYLISSDGIEYDEVEVTYEFPGVEHNVYVSLLGDRDVDEVSIDHQPGGSTSFAYDFADESAPSLKYEIVPEGRLYEEVEGLMMEMTVEVTARDGELLATVYEGEGTLDIDFSDPADD